MTNARVRFAVLVMTLLMIPVVVATADHLEGITMTVVITSSSTVDERTERILTESVLIALNRSRVEAVVGDLQISGEEPSRRDITRLARQGGSDFVLICTYNPVPESPSLLGISLALYLADPPIPVAALSDQARINLSLDRVVEALLDTLLAEGFAYLEAAELEVVGQVANADDGEDTGTAAGSGDTGGTGGSLPVGQQPVANKTLEFSAGYSPTLAVGDASGYYQFAHGARGHAHIILGKRNALGIGIAASAIFAPVSGVATGGELLIVPFAASLAFRSNPAPLGAYMTLGGGGALLRVSNPVLGTFMKVAPYATVGMGMKLALLDWVGIDASVNFDAIFEGSVFLTSVAPSLSLSMEF